MFTHRTKLHLKDTDATGVLYFSEQFSLVMQAFESYLESKFFSLKQLLNSSIQFPVVHAEGDYFAPLQVGDEVEIKMAIEAIGTSSVTFVYQLVCLHRQKEVGRVKIVHVSVDRKTALAVPLPDFLRTLLTSSAPPSQG